MIRLRTLFNSNRRACQTGLVFAALLAVVPTVLGSAADPADRGVSPALQPIHWLDVAVLISYFAVIVGMGLWFLRGSSGTLRDYYRGENNIPPFAAGLSLMATRLSAVTFISIPAKAYATNWAYILLPFSNLVVAGILTRWIIPFYCRLNLTSIYEYLKARFDDSIWLLGSLAFLGLETARLGVLILVPALVITVVADLNLSACILAIGVITTLSTVFGGIRGVIWIDVLQAFLMLLGALLCIGTVCFRLDHPLEGLRAAVAVGKLKIVEPSFDLSQASLVIIALYWAGEIKNYIANQTNAQRFMVTKDVASARRSIWIGTGTMVGTILLCMMVGTALFVFYSAYPERLKPGTHKPDELVPWFIIREIPIGLAGLTLAAIFSAAMSSLNSALNSISSVAVVDLYRRFSPGSTDRDSLRFGKKVIVLVGFLATVAGLLMARHHVDSLFDQLIEILGLFGGPLGGIFLLGIFTVRGNARGAWTGFAGSCLVLAYVKFFTPLNLLAYMAVGMFSCFALGYLVSRIWPVPQPDLKGLTIHT